MNFAQRRWMYLSLSVIIAICTGIGYTWSVFQDPLIAYFHWQLTAASLIFTSQVAISTLTPIFIGKYQAKIGTRRYLALGALIYGCGLIGAGHAFNFLTFYLSFSIGVGIGIGMLYPCLMGYAVQLIPERRGLATGLIAGSFGSGALVWAPIAVKLQAIVGILSVYTVLGCSFIVIIISLVLLLRAPDINFKPKVSAKITRKSYSGTVEMNWHQMVRTTKFWMLLALFAIGTSSGLMIIGHASAILIENLGINATQAAFLVGIMSISNASGPIIWGTLSDSLGRGKTLLILFAIVTCSMFTLYFTRSHTIFICAILITGFAYGGFAALIAPASADLFGTHHVNVNYGFLYISFGLGGTIGPQIGAFSKSIAGHYTPGFMIIASLCVVGMGLAYRVFYVKPIQTAVNHETSSMVCSNEK